MLEPKHRDIKRYWREREHRAIHNVPGCWRNRCHQRILMWYESEIFNFHRVRSVITAKLKTKSSQKVQMYKFKVDTGSNSNLWPSKVFKLLFPHSKITDLNKSIDKIIYAYNNLCIEQMAVCKVTIINKGIKLWCSFFVVTGNGLAFLGMSD